MVLPSINEGKTKAMLITGEHLPLKINEEMTLTIIEGTELELVPSAKLLHRRMGNMPGGGGNPFAKKTLASCPNIYKKVERKLLRAMQQNRPYWHMKVAR